MADVNMLVTSTKTTGCHDIPPVTMVTHRLHECYHLNLETRDVGLSNETLKSRQPRLIPFLGNMAPGTCIATAKSFCAYFLKPYHGHNFKATAYIYSILESLSSSLFKACFVWSIALTVFIQHVFEVGYPLIFHHTRFAMFRVQFDLFDL